MNGSLSVYTALDFRPDAILTTFSVNLALTLFPGTIISCLFWLLPYSLPLIIYDSSGRPKVPLGLKEGISHLCITRF